MLYTFSQSHYDLNELNPLLQTLKNNDALVFWQDGVLFFLKNAELFAGKNTLILKEDLIARGLTSFVDEKKQASILDLVQITEQYFPQMAL